MAEQTQPQAPGDAVATTEHHVWRDDWIQALIKDPREIPDAVVISGYVGDSTDPKMVRVYFDPHLQRAVDVPVDTILHREEIPRASSPLGGSYLWIASSAWPNCVHYSTRR